MGHAIEFPKGARVVEPVLAWANFGGGLGIRAARYG
jgi:hypothetical protein